MNSIVMRESVGKMDSTHDSTSKNAIVSAKNVDVFYGDKQALFGMNLDVMENSVTALIGPSGVWEKYPVALL